MSRRLLYVFFRFVSIQFATKIAMNCCPFKEDHIHPAAQNALFFLPVQILSFTAAADVLYCSCRFRETGETPVRARRRMAHIPSQLIRRRSRRIAIEGIPAFEKAAGTRAEPEYLSAALPFRAASAGYIIGRNPIT